MQTLQPTRHALTRARQRGVRENDLDLVHSYGTQVPGGIVLTKKDVSGIERELKLMIDRLHRLEGCFIALDGNVAITTYKATSRQVRRRLRYSRDGGG